MSLKTLQPRNLQQSALALAIALTSFIPVAIHAADVPAPAVSMTWIANPESNIAGYKLHFGSSSRNYGTVLNVGAVRSAPLPAMILGRTYYVALSAYDTANRDSPLSAELVVIASPPAPVADTGFATSSAGQGSLQWRYSKTASIPADRFAIESSTDLKTWLPAGSITPGGAVRSDAQWIYFNVPFATDKPRQFFRVGAVNPFGTSD